MLIVWVSFNCNWDSLLRFIDSNVYIRWIFDKGKHDFKVHGKTHLSKSAVGLDSCIPCWTFEVVVTRKGLDYWSTYLKKKFFEFS